MGSSPVSASVTDSATLYSTTSPIFSDDKAGVGKLAGISETEIHPGSSVEKETFIRRLQRSRLVAMLLMYASPLAGLVALTFAVMHIVACFAILYASDRAPVNGWLYAPQVYLAILTAISNKALAFAIVQGTVVTWWLRAMRSSGTTLAQLHYDWATGLHVWQAMGAGRHFGILAFACICATFVAVDGPLLQSASFVKAQTPMTPVTLEVTMSPQLPAYFSGWMILDNFEVSDMTDDFRPFFQGYLDNEPMEGFIAGCDETCTATIEAPALEFISCASESETKDYLKPLTDAEQKAADITNVPPYDREAFSIEPASLADKDDELLVRIPIGLQSTNANRSKVITIASTDENVTENCSGSLIRQSCYFASAIGRYDIRIQDGRVTFQKPPSHPEIVAR